MPKSLNKSSVTRSCSSCNAPKANHGLAWNRNGDRWCSTCVVAHQPYAVDLRDRRYCVLCVQREDGKPKNATYGLPGKSRKWCSACAPNGAEDVTGRRCSCPRRVRPIFGMPDDQRPTWCANCPDKPVESEDIVNRRCPCPRRACPSVGMPSDARPTWCAQCPNRPVGAEDIKNRRCPCSRRVIAVFGLPDDARPTWCAQCPDKPVGAEDIKNRRCPCPRRVNPAFGLTNDARPTWCVQCPDKPADAEDIINRRCPCSRRARPSFGLPEDGHRIWCANCPDKPDEAEDLKKRRCPCPRRVVPIFGMADDLRPRWCANCPGKPVDAEDILNRRCACPRRVRPNFGMPNDARPTWCANCPDKPASAENVVSERCVVPLCTTQTKGSRYNDYCFRCYVLTYPNRPVARNYKTKEHAVAQNLQSRLGDTLATKHLTITFDKRTGGCSARRPDCMIECLTHVVFVEVDEEQHNTPEYKSCENKRMMELFEDIGSRPVIFVRFNPDAYKDAYGERKPSCFELNHFGLSVIRDKTYFQERLNVLWERVLEHCTTIPGREITLEHLYYNGFQNQVRCFS